MEQGAARVMEAEFDTLNPQASGGQLNEDLSGVSAIKNPYMFTARRYDEETGLYHYRHRAYDPATGRFLQRDPLGYVDGPSLYEYVRSRPSRLTDPYGLDDDEDEPNWFMRQIGKILGFERSNKVAAEMKRGLDQLSRGDYTGVRRYKRALGHIPRVGAGAGLGVMAAVVVQGARIVATQVVVARSVKRIVDSIRWGSR